MYKILFAILLSVFANHAFARGNCEAYLQALQPTEFDFQVSDLEGLYLELLEDAIMVAAGNDVSLDTMESFLKKKATVLNRLIPITAQLRNGKKSLLPLEQIYKMLESLGVSPKGYGLQLAENGRAEFIPREDPEEPEEPSQASVEQPVERRPIGFIPMLRDPRDDDFPRRSIGFHPFEKKQRDKLPRRIGRLRIQAGADPATVKIVDPVQQLSYDVPLDVLQMGSAMSDEKSFSLVFDDEFYWILSYKNLSNPTGAIGFQFPATQ